MWFLDDEQDNVTYTLMDAGTGALEFFFIDKDSGQLMLRKSLTEGSGTEYKVSLRLTI